MRFRMARRMSAFVFMLVVNPAPLFGQSSSAPESELLVRQTADVHKFPSIASPVIGRTTRGTVLPITRSLGSWVEVSWPDGEAGRAFLHVNTGTVAPRAAEASPSSHAAVAEISAVAAAASSAGAADVSPRSTGATTPRATEKTTYLSLPSHRVGVGALASGQALGGTARTWFAPRLGVQFSVTRPTLEHADGRSATSTQFAPSVLFSIADFARNAIWLRPYVGGGPRIYDADLGTGLGYELLGGAETTLAVMPQVALSADVGYRWVRPSFADFQPRQMSFSLSAHWYVK